MIGVLKSIAAIYLAVAALGAAVIGVHMLLPVSFLKLPGEWATPLILGVLGGTIALSGGLFWLSDLLVSRMIGTPDSRLVFTPPPLCYLCRAELLRDALTCPGCGALVQDRLHPRSAKK